MLGLAIGLLPLVGIYRQELIPHIGDRFARANLQADIPFSFWRKWLMAYIYGVGDRELRAAVP